jgi:hypothetical protein
VRRVAALSAPITFGSYTGTLCHVLQYVSSVAGLLILAIWYRRLPTPTPVADPPGAAALSTSGRTVLLVMVCLVAAAVGTYRATQLALEGSSNYRVIYVLLTRSISWFVAVYLAVGLIVTFTRKKPEPLAEI